MPCSQASLGAMAVSSAVVDDTEGEEAGEEEDIESAGDREDEDEEKEVEGEVGMDEDDESAGEVDEEEDEEDGLDGLEGDDTEQEQDEDTPISPATPPTAAGSKRNAQASPDNISGRRMSQRLKGPADSPSQSMVSLPSLPSDNH